MILASLILDPPAVKIVPLKVDLFYPLYPPLELGT